MRCVQGFSLASEGGCDCDAGSCDVWVSLELPPSNKLERLLGGHTNKFVPVLWMSLWWNSNKSLRSQEATSMMPDSHLCLCVDHLCFILFRVVALIHIYTRMVIYMFIYICIDYIYKHGLLFVDCMCMCRAAQPIQKRSSNINKLKEELSSELSLT